MEPVPLRIDRKFASRQAVYYCNALVANCIGSATEVGARTSGGIVQQCNVFTIFILRGEGWYTENE